MSLVDLTGDAIPVARDIHLQHGRIGIQRAVRNVNPEDAGELGPGSAADLALLTPFLLLPFAR